MVTLYVPMRVCLCHRGVWAVCDRERERERERERKRERQRQRERESC